MRPDTIIKEIRCDFTDQDKLEMGDSLSKKLVEVEAVESEKKSADGVFNERRKVLEGEIESLYRRYHKGYEMAQIGCDIRYNHPLPGQKSYIRMDTGELADTVDMSWEEKQDELQFNLNTSAEGQPQPSDEQVDDVLGKLDTSEGTPPAQNPELPNEENPPEAA